MLKKIFWVMMMALLFCTAAAAEEVAIDVTTAKQLVEAVDAANAAGAATPEGQTAPLYRIRIMNDIHDDCSVSKGWLISVENGARVIVEGAAEGEKAPVLTMDWSSMGSPSYGGFVSLFEAQLRLVNLTFDFTGSEKSPGVGGLILYSGELEAEKCTLRNMKPWKGSLDFAPRAAVVSLGGSLKMKNCTVKNIETYNMFPDNGAIALLATDAEFDGCTFQNTTSDQYGSCIKVINSPDENGKIFRKLKVTNCEFTSNRYPQAPCIAVIGTDVLLKDSLFEKNGSVDFGSNTSDGAGAVLISQCDALVDGCTFSENTTDLSGGALLFMYGTKAKIVRSTISQNVAATHGGAICVADFFSENPADISVLTIEDTLIEDNIAKCIYNEEGHCGDNFAPGGGAIYVHPACELTLGKGTILRGNEAQNHGNGGAVYASYDGVVTINGAIIENNKAAASGGAVYLEGAGDFAGEQGSHDPTTAPPKSYGTGALLTMNDGLITGNHAALSGGAVYAAGQTMANLTEYRGAHFIMKGGVITANQADDMGGGVYVQAAEKGAQAGEFTMTGGAVYFNVAGENGNTSTGAADAGAEVYCEGGNATISVVSAADITRYIQNPVNAFVPAKDRQVWFTNWYDDYSDQCPAYGKGAGKQGTGVNTGRYMSSLTIDRMVYQPLANDSAYNALILDRETQLKLHKQEKNASEMKGQYFVFEITLPSLPPVDLVGKLYPVTFTQNVICPSVSTLPDGRPAIDLSGGKVTLFMKSGDNLEIGGLPAGTQFKIIETDHAGLPDVDISSGNVVTPDISLPKYVITGSTVTTWNGGRTRSDVFYHNNTDEPSVPATGDDNRPLLWLALCLLSAGLLCAARRKVNG